MPTPTRILYDPRIDLPDGTQTSHPVDLEFVPTGLRTTAEVVVYPAVIRYPAVMAGTQILLDPPDPSWAWKATARQGASVLQRRTITWTATSTIAWADLTDVDPHTLEPTPDVTASWGATAALAQEVKDELDAVKAGAPSGLDTFLELANQLQSDESGAAALAALVAGKADASALTAETTARQTLATSLPTIYTPKPAFYLDARTAPNGPLPGAFGNSPFVVNNGALEHTATVSSNSAAYYQQTLAGPAARNGGIPDWDTGATGSVAFVFPLADWSDTTLGNAGIHAVVDASGHVTSGRFEAGTGVVNAHTGEAGDLTGGRHLIDVTADRRRNVVTVYVDGKVIVQYVDATAFTMISTRTVQELYEANGTSGVPARFLALWGDTEARVPPAAPLPGYLIPAASPSGGGSGPNVVSVRHGSYDTALAGGYPGIEIGAGAARLAVTVPSTGKLLARLAAMLQLDTTDNVLVFPRFIADAGGTIDGDAVSVTQAPLYQRVTLEALMTGLLPGATGSLAWMAFQVGSASGIWHSGGAAGMGVSTAIPVA